jgi:uncharacterized damage-inducible protein DinB
MASPFQFSTMSEEFLQEFVNDIIDRLDENTTKLKTCLDELAEQDVWKRPNEHSNSVGNLMLHLAGNIRQWIISSLGNAEDLREREKEFAADGGYSKPELAAKLFSTVEEAKKIIRDISTEEILKKRKVQAYFYSGVSIIIHVTEHYSYHTGQIIFWTKLLKDKDLGFYAGVNLNEKNETR